MLLPPARQRVARHRNGERSDASLTVSAVAADMRESYLRPTIPSAAIRPGSCAVDWKEGFKVRRRRLRPHLCVQRSRRRLLVQEGRLVAGGGGRRWGHDRHVGNASARRAFSRAHKIDTTGMETRGRQTRHRAHNRWPKVLHARVRRCMAARPRMNQALSCTARLHLALFESVFL